MHGAFFTVSQLTMNNEQLYILKYHGFLSNGQGLQLVADDVFACVFQRNLIAGIEGGEGNFLIPIIALFTGAVLVRLAEEDQAGAKDTVHQGRLRLFVVIDQRFGMRTAAEGGLNQLFIPMQGQAEKLNKEDRNSAEKGKHDYAQPFHPDDHGIDEQAQDYSQDDPQQRIALFQLGRELLKVIIGVEFFHKRHAFLNS